MPQTTHCSSLMGVCCSSRGWLMDGKRLLGGRTMRVKPIPSISMSVESARKVFGRLRNVMAMKRSEY